MDGTGKRRQVSICDGVKDQDKTVISNIMQRFRPIAPKPVVGESSDDTKSCKFLGRNRRSKRKYVRARDKNNSNNKDMIIGKNIKTNLKDNRSDVVTLQLLPEKDKDLGNNIDQGSGSDLSDMDPKTSLYGSIVDLSLTSLDRTVVESWLTVECVSDTCTDLGGYHIMDQGEERVMKILDIDTCPWLVSDGSNLVYWVNRAYRRMVGVQDEELVKVWLVVAMEVMEEIKSMMELYGAVTCRVRVKYKPYTCKKERGSEVTMTVPCDVRRISSGGFCWRLDVESALRLGM